MRLRSVKVIVESLLSLLVALVCYATPVVAQDTQTTQLPAPPPLRVLSASEREQLNQTSDMKSRVRRAVELSSARLQRAEELVAQQQYDHALMELGGYLALIADAFKSLSQADSDRGKVRDIYKRLELSLRADGPRIQALRRGAPLEYAVRIKEVEDFAREGRTEALNSFYGHTVIREEKQTSSPENKPKDPPDKLERLP